MRLHTTDAIPSDSCFGADPLTRLDDVELLSED
ncbi:hypothetical protein DFR74_1455 [Nocardia puris]|uniref:Uncharacterized protein n=1 Tax=Nocardia puris TaxID=208602 RepID=A0A366CSR3_9NOCA|nr:hypothetical protein DFR74_1455 [Nocardia puris]